MVIIDDEDLGKSKEQILTDLLFESNFYRIPLQYITFGKPQEVDARPEVMTDPNTVIPVQIDPTYDSRVSRDAALAYRRRLISDHLSGQSFTFQLQRWPIKLSEIVDEEINPHLAYPLTVDEDYLDYDIPAPNIPTVTVSAHPDSLLFCSEFDITVLPIDSSYLNLVAITNLTGFVPFVE